MSEDTYENLIERLDALYSERKILNDAISVLERLKQDIDREEKIKKETREEFLKRMNYDR